MKEHETVFRRLQTAFTRMVDEHGLADEKVHISARTLTPREALGNPESEDYPILKGKERMMEAIFREARGHAFTDMFGEWSGSLADVANLEPVNNFRRAIFVASLNAVMRSLKLVERTVHCRDDGPSLCGAECLQMLYHENPEARILLVGHQPRMLERLSAHFHMSVVDLDPDNIGKEVFGVKISGPEAMNGMIDDFDVLLVTGTTLVNDTIGDFLDRKPTTIFYGVSIAGAAELLGLRRFCPCGL